MDSPVNKYAKTEFRLLDPSALMTKPVTALLGVSPAAASLLGNLNIETVFDLASSIIFGAARRIVEAAENPSSDMALAGSVPLDMIDVAARTVPVGELQVAPLEKLRGVSDKVATGIADVMSIATIRDAAFWPPYVAARHIVNVTLGGSEEEVDNELPAELVPRMGRYPTERLQYKLLLLDKVLEPAPALQHIKAERFALRGPATVAQEGMPIESAGPVDLSTAVSSDAGFQKPALGALVTFTQSWYTLGLSLGHLLHALALAPGESTRIAVVDWRRRSSAQSGESTSESDLLQSALDRGRSISEVASAVAHELQTGEASSAGAGTSLALGEGGGAAGGGEYQMFKGAAAAGHSTGFSAGAGFAHSWASSAGVRNIAAETTQKIVDATHQASSMVRSRRATAIREISQSEHETLSTRSVTNFNHMHAMTMQYYEIVQVYKTVNELARVERCLFIPMRPVDFSSRSIVARFRGVLAAGALNSQVRATVLSTPNSVVLVPARRSQPWDQGMLDRLKSLFGMTVGYPSSEEIVLPRNLQPWGLSFVIPGDNTNMQEYPFDAAVIEFEGGPTQTVPITILNQASDLGGKFIDFRQLLGTGESAKDFWTIRTISLKRKAGKEAFAGEIVVLAAIYPFGTTGGITEGKGWLGLHLRVEANEMLVRVYTIMRTISDDSLVRHLVDNSLYYSQIIWRSLDAPTLGLLLSPYTLQGRPLIEMLDPTPLAVAGNYLVFRTYAEDAAWTQFLKEKGLQVGAVRESLVPLPSGGVFAEAVLGRANSAEKLDITRFWNWQDSPIPIQAPEIAALQAGSRAQAEDLMPGQLGAPTVNIINPPDAPDPQGMSGILAAIQNGNMFRDMSGLGATIGFAQSAMTRAFDAARDAASQAGENAKTAADVLKTMYGKGGVSDGGGSTGGSGSGQTGGTSQLPATPSNLGALVNHGTDLDQRESGSDDPASEWAQWPGGGGAGDDGLSPPPLVSTDNERAATYGTIPPARTPSQKAKPTPVRLYVEGRVTRDGRATQEPVSGVLTLLLSRQTVANQQAVPTEVIFDLTQGVGSNMPSLVRNEEYVLRPKITMTPDAIANRLDEALAAARFEVPGLNIGTLVSEVRNLLTTPRAINGTGRTIIVPAAAKSITLELLANVETVPDFTSEVTLDGELGFKGNVGAKASFDSRKLGDLAAAIVGLIKDPESKAVASGIAGILTLFTLSFEYGSQTTASGGVKVGTKFALRPQLLRSIELRDKK